MISFQSPSHRGPRARRGYGNYLTYIEGTCFSPLLIGGRARGQYIWDDYVLLQYSFSPLLIGGRARGSIRSASWPVTVTVSVPFS